MSEIKNIIFDLGGVLMNIDYNRTTSSFIDLGFTNFENMYSQFKANDLFVNLEKGLISTDIFYDALLASKPTLEPQDLTDAWNAMLLDFRTRSLAFLIELKKTYKLFLLSNTNSIHRAAFETIFRRETGYESLDDFFTKAYYSNDLGMRKPDEEIFEYVLADAGILASETYFVDDIYLNTTTAEKLGFKTHLLVAGTNIEDLDYTQ